MSYVSVIMFRRLDLRRFRRGSAVRPDGARFRYGVRWPFLVVVPVRAAVCIARAVFYVRLIGDVL